MLLLCCFRFDTDEDDEIATADIVLALSAMVGSDGREQVNVGFALCDSDSDGRLTVTPSRTLSSGRTRRVLLPHRAVEYTGEADQAGAGGATQQEEGRTAATTATTSQERSRKQSSRHSRTTIRPTHSSSSSSSRRTRREVASAGRPAAARRAAADTAAAAQSQFNSSRPASPSFSLSTLRREVSSLLINAATTAASHCFTVHTHPPLDTGTSIDAQRLWEWMDAVRLEGGGEGTRWHSGWWWRWQSAIE